MCRREGNECKTCVGNNCNLKASFQSCHTCDSDTNINCVTLKEALPTKVCRNYADECATVTLLGGRTERGCTSEIPVIGDAVADQCPDSDCNANIFPPNRISCHQCSGSQCSGDLTTTTEFVEMCQNFVANDQCFSFVDGECSRSRIPTCRYGGLLTEFCMSRNERNASRLCIGQD